MAVSSPSASKRMTAYLSWPAPSSVSPTLPEAFECAGKDVYHFQTSALAVTRNFSAPGRKLFGNDWSPHLKRLGPFEGWGKRNTAFGNQQLY
jgi:hypothetical protein